MPRLLVLSLLTLSSPAAAAPREGVRATLDLRYAAGSNGRHTLDVFAPDDLKPGEKRPVVIFVHGGTWMVGDKNFFGVYRDVGRRLAKDGFVGVCINYRLSPLVRHPEHVKDVARAFAWVRANIARYGGDRDRLFLAGHSAGAHLVSLLAADERYLKDPKLGLGEADRKALRGVIPVSGVYRIPPPDEFKDIARRTVNILVGDPSSGRFAKMASPALMAMSGAVNPFSLVFGRDAEVQRAASPITHVRPGMPPFLMLNAEYEVPGLHAMAADFERELKRVGVPVEHHEIAGTTHKTVVKKLHGADDEATKLVAAFVKKHAG